MLIAHCYYALRAGMPDIMMDSRKINSDEEMEQVKSFTNGNITYLDNICPSVLGLWRMGLQVLFGIRSGIHQIGPHIWPWLGRSRSFLAHIEPGH